MNTDKIIINGTLYIRDMFLGEFDYMTMTEKRYSVLMAHEIHTDSNECPTDLIWIERGNSIYIQ